MKNTSTPVKWGRESQIDSRQGLVNSRRLFEEKYFDPFAREGIKFILYDIGSSSFQVAILGELKIVVSQSPG